jgi:hypothetical protein
MFLVREFLAQGSAEQGIGEKRHPAERVMIKLWMCQMEWMIVRLCSGPAHEAGITQVMRSKAQLLDGSPLPGRIYAFLVLRTIS